MQTKNGCPLCVHYKWSVEFDMPTCAAFPEGLPEEIWMKGFDHRAEFEGDQGIRFQARDEEGAVRYGKVMTPFPGGPK